MNDAGSAVVIIEQAYADKILAARDGARRLEHVVVIDGDVRRRSHVDSTSSIARGDEDFDFEAAGGP